MVMGEILYKWRQGLKLELEVAYVHHGKSPSKKQNAYRDKAQKFVQRWAKEHQLKFHTNRSAPKLSGEQELRAFREEKLLGWLKRQRGEAIAFAHHEDDLLETRLIRLIRGSGIQGLGAMRVLKNQKFRPLLSLSAHRIRAYADACGLKWLEDPSNEDQDLLRNWIRHEWLPSLERHRPGGMKALARSLETIVPQAAQNEMAIELASHVGLRRDVLVTGPARRSREILAQYLKSLGVKSYSQSHVDEILKRVSNPQNDFEFDMLSLKFKVSPKFLWASRV